MLMIKNVSKFYGDKKVVDQVNFNIKAGKITGIIGPNGAGKTTLLSMIVGILKTDEGEINYSYSNNDLRKDLAYIPDSLFLYENLTGREYVEFIANIYGIKKSDYTVELEILSKTLFLEEKLDSFIRTYSKGMRQKISLIGALIHKPKILILDEPFNGLDPESIRVIKQYFKEYTNKGNSILFSSHVLDIVEKLCDHFVIIHKGKIRGEGSLEEIKSLVSNKSKDLEDIFYELTQLHA